MIDRTIDVNMFGFWNCHFIRFGFWNEIFGFEKPKSLHLYPLLNKTEDIWEALLQTIFQRLTWIWI